MHIRALYDNSVTCKNVHVNRKEEEMTFAEHLLKLRTERNIKQQEVIQAIGVSLRAYQYYESGKREPQMSTLIALADFYDLSLDELVCRERG